LGIWIEKSEQWYVGGGKLTGAFHILRVPVLTAATSNCHLLLQQNQGLFDILVSAYPSYPGNWQLK